MRVGALYRINQLPTVTSEKNSNGKIIIAQMREEQIMDINIIWDNEELEVIEELNEIFNL